MSLSANTTYTSPSGISIQTDANSQILKISTSTNFTAPLIQFQYSTLGSPAVSRCVRMTLEPPTFEYITNNSFTGSTPVLSQINVSSKGKITNETDASVYSDPITDSNGLVTTMHVAGSTSNTLTEMTNNFGETVMVWNTAGQIKTLTQGNVTYTLRYVNSIPSFTDISSFTVFSGTAALPTPILRGQWDSTVTYATGDMIVTRGRLYVATAASTAADPVEGPHWIFLGMTLPVGSLPSYPHPIRFQHRDTMIAGAIVLALIAILAACYIYRC